MTLCICCGVCDGSRQSVFLMVADLTVGAVKHSGVFGCEWNSLADESVRHGVWLYVCWTSSAVPGECGWWRRAQSGLLTSPASSFPFSPLSLICPAALSFILFPFPSSISQQGFISCDSPKPIISPPPTSIPSQPLNNNAQPLDQSPKRPGSFIDAYQGIHCC